MKTGRVPSQPSSSQPRNPKITGVSTSSKARASASPNPLLSLASLVEVHLDVPSDLVNGFAI